jgi:glycosyltransferase involved in cell wall biosynthesis
MVAILERVATRSSPKVAAVVISHNYGRFLAECLDSVLSQTTQPSEIIVIDDASSDDTPQITEQFRDRGVRYARVSCRNVHQARRMGFEKTTAEVLCFLDADDLLPPDYIVGGLKHFLIPEVAVVYSDMEFFGTRDGRTRFPLQFNREILERDNYLHAGSLVHREALQLSRAFERKIDPLLTQGDWFLWRQVLRDGWIARKQEALYRYRQHGTNWSDAMQKVKPVYFDYAGLRHEILTLFIPLSGRQSLWPGLADYLDRQSWPHDQVRLILMDTSQNLDFSRTVRDWMATCDYPDVHYFREAVARSGIADDDRYQQEVQDEVRRAVARIYNRMAREVATDYVWVLEDDILPPDDAAERLLRGFDDQTASVSSAYRSRYDGMPCVWDGQLRHLPESDENVEVVHGNGFGCVVVRGGLLRRTVFQATGDYDRVFYGQVQRAGLKAKLDWRVQCEHRSSPRELASVHQPPERASE